MRPQDIVIGESYRFRAHPHYSYAKAMEMLKPKQGENPHTYAVVKCLHSVNKDETWGIVRHFRPSDLVKDSGQ